MDFRQNQAQLNRERQREVHEAPVQEVQNAHVQQMARQMENQLGQIWNPYTRFLRNLTIPPENAQVPRAEQLNLDQEHLGRKEREQQKERFAALGRKHTLLNAEDMRQLSNNKMFTNAEMRESWEKSKYKQSKITNAETMRQLANKDYSNFENVQPTLKNVVASRELQEFRRNHPDIITDANYDINGLVQRMKQEGGVEALMNPALRLGLSLARHTEDVPDIEKENYRRLDEAMSTELMVETLTHRQDAESYRQRLITECGVPEAKAAEVARAELAAAEAQKVEIAKRLLLMQLSHFDVYDKQGNRSEWTAPVAVALSHCRRVVLTMPVTREGGNPDEESEMWNTIFHSQNNAAAMDKRRASSTHSLKRRRVDSNGPTKETKIKTGNLIGQRGMNVAIGGIGNPGIHGRMIRNNGSCGHFYSMYKESKGDSYGAMLFGLESDAHGVVNQMGHRHNIKATAEAASSLGGQRVDEIGADYGGRQCSLTHLTPHEITQLVQALENRMAVWSEEENEEMMRTLAGNKLSDIGVMFLRERLGVPGVLRLL